MLVDSMHLEQRLCQIDSSCRNLHGDAPSLKWLAYTSTLAPRCRSRKGASIPLSLRTVARRRPAAFSGALTFNVHDAPFSAMFNNVLCLPADGFELRPIGDQPVL